MPIDVKKHPYWYVWGAMIQRCTNPKNPGYAGYGGRGITVCDRWRQLANFESDMGPRPFPGASLERVDNDKGYSPENCKWATTKEQGKNKRQSVGISGHKGVVANKKAWSARYYDPDTEQDYCLGTYATIEEAVTVRRAFETKYAGDKDAAIASIRKDAVRLDSRTGVKGVTITSGGKFHAYIHPKGGRRVDLGYFDTLEDAKNAVEANARKTA